MKVNRQIKAKKNTFSHISGVDVEESTCFVNAEFKIL